MEGLRKDSLSYAKCAVCGTSHKQRELIGVGHVDSARTILVCNPCYKKEEHKAMFERNFRRRLEDYVKPPGAGDKKGAKKKPESVDGDKDESYN